VAAPAPAQIAGEVAYESKFQWFTRLGFAARGLLYILIAVLVIATGRTEDLTGALEYVGHGTGKLLLVALAAGLATYGLWRLSDLVLGTEHRGTSWQDLGKRTVAGGIGLIYLYLAYKASRIALGSHVANSETSRHVHAALDLPGGDLVLFAVAAGLPVARLNQPWKSAKCTFLRRLREGADSAAWIRWMGRLGYAARGVVFFVVAWLIYRSAVDHSPAEAGNVEKALDVLRGPFLVPIAAGLLLFGLFSLVEARFRRIHRPPVERVEQKVREKVAG